MFIYNLGSAYLIYYLFPVVYMTILLFYKYICENYIYNCEYFENDLFMNLNLSVICFLLLTACFYMLEKLVTYLLNTIISIIDYFLVYY